jgi:hypothetical protein
MKYQSDCPEHLVEHLFERHFPLPADRIEKVWRILQHRETFTKGQIPPYRVEFDSDSQAGPFNSGELNIHHGPLLSVHGVIGEVNDHYRDLKYFYGSYVLSFRLVRPTRLEFFKTSTGVELKIHSFVHPGFRQIWELGNKIFWRFFGISFLF